MNVYLLVCLSACLPICLPDCMHVGHHQHPHRHPKQHQQVYLLSFAKDDALTQWMRKLNTAMIIGPGARTSGFREPSAPYMVSKSHRSLTVMWLPPRQPYLNSVHSFQVCGVMMVVVVVLVWGV